MIFLIAFGDIGSRGTIDTSDALSKIVLADVSFYLQNAKENSKAGETLIIYADGSGIDGLTCWVDPAYNTQNTKHCGVNPIDPSASGGAQHGKPTWPHAHILPKARPRRRLSTTLQYLHCPQNWQNLELHRAQAISSRLLLDAMVGLILLSCIS